ncbi:MAG TPA: hypothetical protein VJR48_09560, partial [Ktedonobacterales bacterium]|nr:hypothetical protein [Ktedonobacterales bacterium]
MSERADHQTDLSDSEFYIEVSPLSSSSAANQQAPGPRRYMRIVRAIIAGSAIIVALAVIFSGFLPLHTPLTGWALPQPTATSTATPAPTAVVLGHAPTDCPPGNPIEKFSSGFGPGMNLGGQHIWLVGFNGPGPALHASGGVQLTPYGWPYYLMLVAAPDVTKQIVLVAGGRNTVSGDVGGGVRFSIDGLDHAESPLILNPTLTPPGSDGWRAWHLYIFVPAAGCYLLGLEYGGHEMPL